MVYTAPNFSFIDAFTNGAKYIDDKRKAQQDQFMQGLGMLGKGAGEAWKWQQRKEAADELERMQKELAQLQAQRDQLMGGSITGSDTPNLDTFMGGINPMLNTGRI